MCQLVLLFLFTFIGTLKAQEGAQYLQTAIRAINSLQNRRMDLDSKKVGKVEVRSSDVPPLSLTKGELADLYQNAVGNGKIVKIDHGDGPPIQAAVHEIEEPLEWDGNAEISESNKPGGEDGYYYYYYPLKSFIDEMTSQPYTDVSIMNLLTDPFNLKRIYFSALPSTENNHHKTYYSAIPFTHASGRVIINTKLVTIKKYL